MTSKQMLFDQHARARIGVGVDALANVVKVTLGPRGRHVLLDQAWGSPTVTKDGVTVAATIELDEPFANLGAQMVKEVAAQTSKVAGDGTTTATVLAQAIYREGLKLLAAGANPTELKRGIDAAVSIVVSELATLSRPTRGREEIANVGTISANGDVRVGALIAEAMEGVGKEGVVTVEEGTSMETTLELTEGMRLDRGLLSPYFVTDSARMEAVLQEPVILICARKLSRTRELLPLLERVAEAGKPLLIIAEDVDEDALATLVVNRLRGGLDVCAVKAPGFGERRNEMLEDVATLTGTRVLSDAVGTKLEDVQLADLGRVHRATIDKDYTTLVGADATTAAVAGRVKQLRKQIEDASTAYDREKIEERVAKLAGGVAVITLGAATETEMKEKKARVEDALSATRAAVQEGVVPGGGVALLRALPALEKLDLGGDRQLGVRIVRRAIEEPLRQMARNGGVEGAIVVSRVRAGDDAFGYNVASGEYEDLLASGVLDPTKVVRVALQNAASVAGLMMATEALIVARPLAGGDRA